jgi:2-amino-4-hydroxy-6-hydroxymethyldihydropteridine diphosphokinase/dihydropteroate synthase
MENWDKPFLNMIIGGQTSLSPIDLLHSLKRIEKEMGRPKEYKAWAPRIIDLDILLYNDLSIETEHLTIPHPEIENRSFIQHLLALMQVEPWAYKQDIAYPFPKSFTLKPKLVGVINITMDSFSDGGKFYNTNNAADQVIKLAEEGASIIEIGAQSTKPGAIIQSAESEYAKLEDALNKIMPIVVDKKLQISIDTFHPSIAVKLVKKYDISIVNDVKGNFDNDYLKVIANNDCKFCLVHSITIPPNKKNVIPTCIVQPTDYLVEWMKSSVKKLTNLGFPLRNIILDPGIGFGKTPYQNINILKNVEQFSDLGCQIMIGHSRKSYIQTFSEETQAEYRDMETIGVSLAICHKIDFLRVHNVKSHMKAMVAYYLFQD